MLFERADSTGHGQTRLANWFNTNPEVPAHLKPIASSTIGTMLDSELYFGEFHYPKHCTDIVDDVRIKELNSQEEVLVVPNYVEAIVGRDLWDRVQAVRNPRREKMRTYLGKGAVDDKLIKPLITGVSVKHLLAGLVRCGHCGASMRPVGTSARKDPTGKYMYFACPRSKEGTCCNKQTIPERWLLQVVADRIRTHLLGDEL